MSIKSFFEVVALVVNFSILATLTMMVVGLTVIIAFPEAIQTRGYWRNKIRLALKSLFTQLHNQLRFILDVFDTLCDRQKLKDTLDEIDTGQKSLQLR